MSIELSQDLISVFHDISLPHLTCRLVISQSTEELNHLIEYEQHKIGGRLTRDQISLLPSVLSTRQAYRACGKEPARYRPSAEALLRRILSGKGIYRMNNVIDIVNLISFTSGISIGAFDRRKIVGHITFGIGRPDEKYDAIGRGNLNIDGLPVLRDDIGPFGSPTSDSMRTRITDSTKEFLMIFCNFGKHDISGHIQRASNLLRKFAAAREIDIQT